MKQHKKIVRLSDYRPYPFRIPKIELNFLIHKQYVLVENIMRIEPLSVYFFLLTVSLISTSKVTPEQDLNKFSGVDNEKRDGTG